MPLTVIQWQTISSIHQFLSELLDELDTVTGWADYETWATANSAYIATDADFAAWQLLTDTSTVPPEVLQFITGLLAFAVETHNASVTP